MKSISGYLRKLKRDVFLPGSTNKRWFEINFDKQTISIKENDDSSLYKEIIKFNEITYYNPSIDKRYKEFCYYKYSFKIKTKKRKYILYAKTEEEKNKWDEAFKFILKYNNGEKDSFEIDDKIINNDNISICRNKNKENNIYTIIRVCNTNNESHFSSRKTSDNSNKGNITKKFDYDFQTIHKEDENFIERRNSIVTYFAGNNIKIDKKRKKIISFFS